MMDTVVYDAYPKVDIDEFLPELRLEIPELPDDVLMSYVRGHRLLRAEPCVTARGHNLPTGVRAQLFAGVAGLYAHRCGNRHLPLLWWRLPTPDEQPMPCTMPEPRRLVGPERG